jgi:2,5-furandicarboxylate decarboxylase 1
MALSMSHLPPPPTKPLDASLRGYLASNADIVTRVTKPVHMADIGALSAQSDQPILFENIIEKPNFRLCDILVKTRRSQARALGTSPENYLRTLAYRLRQPPRGFNIVKSAPVKEVVKLHNEADWTELPIPFHKDKDEAPYITAMNIIRDPETGFYNSCHAGTHAVGPRRGLISFVTPHSHAVMRKYRDIEMVQCETLELNVPAEAEIVVEGRINLKDRFKVGEVTSPSMYNLPHYENLPEVEISAITMRADRPIYRNHQTCPDTDHQPLPRLCHEAVLYNRLSEVGLDVKDVRFPTWGAALSCIIQFSYPREGMVNDALMLAMGAPWLNTKLVVAVSPDTNLDDPGDVYHAIATRCDPARDVIVVPNTRGSPYDPSARPLEGQYPWRIVGKMGIDATIKSRHDPADFERAWPRNWGKVKLSDYL